MENKVLYHKEGVLLLFRMHLNFWKQKTVMKDM